MRVTVGMKRLRLGASVHRVIAAAGGKGGGFGEGGGLEPLPSTSRIPGIPPSWSRFHTEGSGKVNDSGTTTASIRYPGYSEITKI